MASSLIRFLRRVLDSTGGGGLNQGCTIVLSCDGEQVKLPVPPPSYEVENPYNNTTIQINNIGDINMIGTPGLKTLKFSSFFPAQDYSFIGQQSEDQWTFIKKIETFATKRKPCRITISGTSISMACTIESFPYSEKDGTNDVYYTLSLKEYRYITPEAEQIDDVTGLNGRVAEVPEQREFNIYPGDGPMDIAARAVGQYGRIDQQGPKRLALYKKLVKGNVNVGDVVKATRGTVNINGKKVNL